MGTFFGFIELQLTNLGWVLLTIIFGNQSRDHFGDFLADFSRVYSTLLPGYSLSGGGAGGGADSFSLLNLTAACTEAHWDPLTGTSSLPSADCLVVDLALSVLLLLLLLRAVDSETLQTSPCLSSLQSLTDHCGQ